jgi:hypothetical protein
MRPHLLACLFSVLPLLLACGCDRDHSRTLERVRQSLDSWNATLDETANQWARGRAPTTFVRQIADAAGRSLDGGAESLGKVPADDPRGRELRQKLEVLRQRARDVSRAATGERGS